MAEEKTTSFIDAENIRNDGDELDKSIILNQVSKIASLGSTDFHVGFIKFSKISVGQSEQPVGYVEDTAKAYRNAVDVLHDLLLCKLDEDATTKINQIVKRVSSVFSKVCKGETSEETGKRILMKLQRMKFQQLCLLLNRIGWMTTQGIVDV